MPGTLYRDPAVLYRDPSQTYRRAATFELGPDLAVQDFIRMEIVDQYQNHKAWLNASALKSVEWTINDSGGAEVDLNMLDPGAAQLLVMGGHELRVTFLNAINPATGQPEVWQGFPVRLQRQDAQSGGSTCTLEGLFSYFKFRIVEYASLMYTNADQIDIAWGLMQTYQSFPNYDRNIHASYTPSGVKRSRYYPRDMHQKIYDVVQAFRADNLKGGFDFTITVDATGNRLWVPGYPNIGQVFPGFVEYGREIVGYNLQDDGMQMATKVYAVGGGSAGVQFEQSYEDVTASAEFGTLVTTFSDSSELDLSWLLQMAKYQVERRNIPIPNYEITVVYDDNNPLLGRIHAGDTLRVRIFDGATNIDQSFRLQTMGWQSSPQPSLRLKFYQPNLQGYEDPLAEEVSLET